MAPTIPRLPLRLGKRDEDVLAAPGDLLPVWPCDCDGAVAGGCGRPDVLGGSGSEVQASAAGARGSVRCDRAGFGSGCQEGSGGSDVMDHERVYWLIFAGLLVIGAFVVTFG